MALVVTTTTSPAGVTVTTYDNMDVADTSPDSIEVGRSDTQTASGPVFGFFQCKGTTAGGITVKLQGSNDGSTWVDLKDVNGTAIAFLNSVGGSEFRTAARYIRPLVSGTAASEDIDVIITTRS